MRVAASLFLLLAAPAWGVDVAGATLPDSWSVQGRTLLLNGAGLREHGVLRLDVYAAALYLPARSGDAAAILASGEPRVLHMKFLRDVSRDDTLRAWDHYLSSNCPAPCIAPRREIEAFKALVPASVAGDTQTYIFSATGVEMLANGRPLGRVEGAAFARLLLSTWIGAAPTAPELKAALLGVPP